jgi:transposase
LDQNGLPIQAIVTEGTTADCSQAGDLRPGIQAQHLLADQGYDNSQATLQKANQADMQFVVPAKKKRKYQRNDNQDWYEMGYRVENAFRHLKRWGGMATGDCKN